MSDDKERPKIDDDLKKEILASKKESGMDVAERAKMMEGKIPMEKPKKEE